MAAVVGVEVAAVTGTAAAADMGADMGVDIVAEDMVVAISAEADVKTGNVTMAVRVATPAGNLT